MLTVESVPDIAGKPIEVGDTVVTVNGQTTGRVCNINCEDDGTAFVAIRPVYHSYGKGVWYASDQVFWVARPNDAAKKKKDADGKPARPAAPATATGKIAGKKVAASKPSPAAATRSTPAKKK